MTRERQEYSDGQLHEDDAVVVENEVDDATADNNNDEAEEDEEEVDERHENEEHPGDTANQQVDDDEEEDDEAEGDEEDEDNDDHDLVLPPDHPLHEILRRNMSFQHKCEKIRSNEPDVTTFADPMLINNARATYLGNCLNGNTHLLSLDINLGPDLVADQGVNDLVQGILGSKVRKLCLTREDAMPMELTQQFFTAIHTVETLELRFPMDDGNLVHLGSSLNGNESLKELSIMVDGGLHSPYGAMDFAVGLRQSQVSKLVLMADSESVCTGAMRLLFLEGIRQCKTLVDLRMWGLVGDMPSVAASITNLRSFAFVERQTGSGITAAQVRLLAHGLRKAKKLNGVRICIRDWGDDEKIQLLFRGIFGGHASIRDVGLMGLETFGDEAVATLLKHWFCFAGVQFLSLEGGNIGPVGALKLIKAIPNHFGFHSLNLRRNKRIGYDGLELIGKELVGLRVIQLKLGYVAKWIKYRDVNCDAAVAQSNKRAAASQALLEGVRGNVYLAKLELDGLSLLPNVTKEIEVYIRANQTCRFFILDQYKKPLAFWSFILAKHQNDASVMFVFLRELPTVMTWRHQNSA